MLISTTAGILNTDHVVSAVPAAAGGRWIVTLTSGSTLTITGQDHLHLERACGAIVQAQPGFDLVTTILPERGETGIVYDIAPVIAFRVGAGWDDPNPIPITLTGEPLYADGRGLWTVRQPGGTCEGCADFHDSLDDFKAYCERTAGDRQRAAR